ncbi:acyl-CoA thioesterase [Methylobacter sp. BlB1]|jgi:acyl-CoA hydrolase|uniref:acyl-CoA thioesterase n=1 Tax=unclassified Methylobacter TaxID=2635283 RepID=UPI001895E020|nr:hotdog domain-containing protein [Methylobacter sp. BlB1]MBF6647999.1 acyl-CoA thioesterase [Methylobacter sp. BlB1]
MDHYKLVLPEHLNHYGYLFGGNLLHWIDEIGYIAANLQFPGHEFVTIGLDNVVFKQSIKLGSILKFETNLTRRGKTSATYNVKVSCEDIDTGNIAQVFETNITFVSIDKTGKKKPINESDADQGSIIP